MGVDKEGKAIRGQITNPQLFLSLASENLSLFSELVKLSSVENVLRIGVDVRGLLVAWT